MKAFVAIVGLYVVLSVVAMLCFDELSSRMSVVISVRNHCDSDDIRCKPSSNNQDLVINLTTPSVGGDSTTLRPVESRRKARLAEWIGPQGYKTYKSNKVRLHCSLNNCKDLMQDIITRNNGFDKLSHIGNSDFKDTLPQK